MRINKEEYPKCVGEVCSVTTCTAHLFSDQPLAVKVITSMLLAIEAGALPVAGEFPVPLTVEYLMGTCGNEPDSFSMAICLTHMIKHRVVSLSPGDIDFFSGYIAGKQSDKGSLEYQKKYDELYKSFTAMGNPKAPLGEFWPV